MVLLAVDTSSARGSLALLRDAAVSEIVPLSEEWKSLTLHTELVRLMERHGLRTGDVEGYAVTNGPGSFTGLRIGLTAVKALAEVHIRPIAAISTLEVIAAAALEKLPASFAGCIASLMDARRGQIFGGLFRAEADALRPSAIKAIMDESVCSLRDFLESVKKAADGKVLFASPENDGFSDELVQAGCDPASTLSVPDHLAGTLGKIGFQRLRAGHGVAPEAADANYVRRSDAEIFWKG